MFYVIDVVRSKQMLSFQYDWLKQTDILLKGCGLSYGQLYKREKDIRNADYNYVSIHAWVNRDVYEESLEHKLLITEHKGINIDRTCCNLEIEIGEFTDSDPSSRWLVNPFEITKEQVPEVLNMWNKAKEYMASKEGFINARLFKSVQKDGKYNLINIAQWKSDELFMNALSATQYDGHRNLSLNYKLHPSLCGLCQALDSNDESHKRRNSA